MTISALVVGASGIVGNNLARHLVKEVGKCTDWRDGRRPTSKA